MMIQSFRMASLPWLSLAIFLVLATVVYRSSGEEDFVYSPGMKPFRMRKINDIWTKAERKLSETKMKRLYQELNAQDERELKWKQLKSNGGDKFGDVEAKNRHKLLMILEDYGLKKHFPMEDQVHDNKSSKKRHEMANKKVERLWEDAKAAGKFNQEELEELRTELEHYSEKLAELNTLKETADYDISENSVMHDQEKKTKDKLNKKLYNTHKDVSGMYEELEMKVRGRKSAQPFEDPRVNDLWEHAVEAKLPEDELRSIKEELQHFDNKLQKHEDIRDQVEHAEKLIADGYDHIKDKHGRLKKKLDDGSRYVEKMHRHLRKKILFKEEL